MDTQDLEGPGEGLPPLLHAMYRNLLRSKSKSTDPLVGELEMVARVLANAPDLRMRTMRSRPSPLDAQRTLIASTGPGSEGKCGACGRDLKK